MIKTGFALIDVAMPILVMLALVAMLLVVALLGLLLSVAVTDLIRGPKDKASKNIDVAKMIDEYPAGRPARGIVIIHRGGNRYWYCRAVRTHKPPWDV